MKFDEQSFDKPRYEGYELSDFRDLVGDLIKNSGTLEDKVINIGGHEEKINILDAIEGNGLSEYAEGGDDKKLDAIHCLTAIYDELKKIHPTAILSNKQLIG